MVRTGSSRRRRLVLGAAGLAALVLGVVVVGVQLTGTPGAWVDAWTDSRASTVLVVRAIGQDGPAGPCGPPEMLFFVEETTSTVFVTARYRRVLPGPGACADIGYGPSSHAIRLRAPIGDRVVVDRSDDRPRRLLVASESATITGLPNGFRTVDLARDDSDGAVVVRRQWQGPGGFVLLITQFGANRRLLYHREVVRYDGMDVRFHVHQDEPRDVYYLEWQMPSGTQANVDLHLPHGTWTPAQALATVRHTTDVGAH